MKVLFSGFLLLLGFSGAAQSGPSIDSLQLIKDVRTLSSDKYEGRKAGTKGSRMAQFYLLDRFKKAGLQPYHHTYEYPFYFNEGEKQIMGTNLYGYIKGTSGKVIVITAHYDHLGIRSNQQGKDSIYNGADDNASGVGALLSLITYFSRNPPAHTLIFAALDGEEEGLQGAKAFVKEPPVPVTDMILNINMDMISRNDKNELYVCGLTPFPQLKPFIDAVITPSAPIKLLAGHDRKEDGGQNWLNQSDHYEFYKLSIPALYFGVEDHADYHKLSDEFERIQPWFYYQAVLQILKVIQQADKGL